MESLTPNVILESYLDTPHVIKFTATSSQNQPVSNPYVDYQLEKVRELIGCLLRKNHLQSHIIGDLKDKVQARNFLKHTTLLSEIEPQHIDDVMTNEY